jgi:hypothetical protein
VWIEKDFPVHILPSSRTRLLYLVVVGLLLIVVFAIFWLWLVGSSSFVSPPLPAYPSAQEISQTVSEKKFHVCNGDGEANEFGVRVTHFVTTDPPDTVRRFYHTALTEQGTYIGHPYSYAGAAYEKFEHETRRAKFYGELLKGLVSFYVPSLDTSGWL